MKTLQTKINWVDDVIPEGLPLKSTTVITGPDGSGKPLIGETFVPAWLKKGGSIIFMSLQYPSTEFITESIKNVTGLDHIKEIADHSRSKVIPAILKIIEN